jgi:hypothetical protein
MDADAPASNTQQQQQVLKTIAETATAPSFAFLTELCKTSSAFMAEQEGMIQLALFSVQKVLDKMIQNRAVELETLGTITEMLRAFAFLVTPANASLLFDLTLRAMALSPLGNTTAYSDETLCRIIEKVPSDMPLSLPAVEEALRSAGPETRYGLADFVPHLCLQDKDPIVRAQALRVLTRRPDMLPAYSDFIIKACTPAPVPSHDGELNLHDNELAVAAAPLLSSLAIFHPPAIGDCLRLLLEAAAISARNDARSVPENAVVEGMNRVVQESNKLKLIQFAASTEGIKMLGKVEKLSPEWKNFVHRLVQQGILKVTIVGYAAGTLPNEINPDTLEEDHIIAEVRRVFTEGDVLLALRLCSQLQSSAPNLFEKEGKTLLNTTLLPAAGDLLPVPTVDKSGKPIFKEEDLNNYDKVMAIMQEIQTLFLMESEQALQMSARISDLNTSMVERYLCKHFDMKIILEIVMWTVLRSYWRSITTLKSILEIEFLLL